MINVTMTDVSYGCFFLLSLIPIVIGVGLFIWLFDKVLEKHRREMIREKRKEEALKQEQRDKEKFIQDLGL